MVEPLLNRARSCAAPSIRNCLIVGEGEAGRLVFVGELNGVADEATAVTLSRSEIEALVGMLNAFLDSGDPEAVGLF